MPEMRLQLPRLHAGQQRVAAEAGRFNVLQCGRRFGKTTFGIDRLIGPALAGYPTAWFAPTYKYLADVWREAIGTLAPVTAASNVQEKRIDLVTGGAIECWTLDSDDPARGRKYKRVVVDEAGIVRDLRACWQESIRPTLTDYRGDAWFLGTPKGRGFFHELYTRGESGGDPSWRAWRMGTAANPFIDPAEIAEAERELPPAVFNQEYLGIPADDGGNPFDLTAIRDCTDDALAAGPAVAFGVDLAKSHDFTCVCGVNADGAVCVLERWQSDWGQTTRRVLDLIGARPALVDSTGVGDPIVEQMQRGAAQGANADGLPRFAAVSGFKFSSTSKQQLLEGLASTIQRREVRFPLGWLTNELESFEYEIRPGGGVRYGAPQGLHDDGVIALALAVQKRHEMRGRRVTLTGAPPLVVG